MNGSGKERNVQKNMIRKIILLFLLGTVAATGKLFGTEEILFQVDPRLDARGQGFDLAGFSGIRTDRAKKVLELRIPAAPRKTGVYLRTCAGMLARMDTRDLEAAELRFTLTPSRPVAQPVKGRFRIHWMSGEREDLEFPVIADGKRHTYQIDFARLKTRPKRTARFYCYIFPDPDGKLPQSELEFESLRLILSPAGTIRNYTENARLRFELLADQLAALQKMRLVPPGAAEEFEALTKRFNRLTAENRPDREKIAPFRELSRRYHALSSQLAAGRELAELLREQEAQESTLRFRRERGETIPAELSEAVRQFGEKNRAAAETFRRTGSAGAEAGAQKELCRTIWNKLLAPEPGELRWQPGASRESFGLFGWQHGNLDLLAETARLDRLERNYFVNPDGSKTMLRFRPDGAEYVGMESTPRSINWTSRSWRYTYSLNGRKIRWELAGSWLAPGVLIDTDAPRMAIAPLSGAAKAPLRLAIPTRQGIRLLGSGELAQFRWRDLSENWLLILGGSQNPEVPRLLTLQHRPASVEFRNGEIILSRPAGVGTVGFAQLYGVRPLPAGWSTRWKQLPQAVAEQCRRLNAVMTAYPWQCDEFFAVDRENNRLHIANGFTYRKIQNDWNYPGREIAPLPPVLPFAVRKGYPAQLPEYENFDFDTIFGPYAGVYANRLEYSLFLPDLQGVSYLKTDRYPQRITRANQAVWSYKEMHPNSYTARPHYPVTTWAMYLDSWNLLNPAERKFLETCNQISLDVYFAATRNANYTLEGIYESHLPAERVEPFTGLFYPVFGWISRSKNRTYWSDITDFSGFLLRWIQLYGRHTGDWDRIRRNWSDIRANYLPLLRRCDWPSMAVGTTDSRLAHSIDMAPDSWLASEAMYKLSCRMKERRFADLAAMVAAREAVPLVTSLFKRELEMAYCNSWDWKSQIPEIGYNQSGAVANTRWDNPVLSTSMIVGMHYSAPLLDLYRSTCPEALAAFTRRMKESYPQWKNPRYLRKGDRLSVNGPLPFARYLFFADVENAPTEELAELASIGALERGGSLWGTTSGSCYYLLSNSAAALLVGRDAPVRLRNWEPARLEQAVYQEQKNTAQITFIAPEPFRAEFISFAEPAEILVNGRKAATDTFRYSPEKKQLELQLGQGTSKVTLRYPGWQPPERVRVEPAPEPPMTREMEYCLAARNRRPPREIPEAVAPERKPLSLEKQFNAALLPQGESLTTPLAAAENITCRTREFHTVPFRIGTTSSGAIALLTGNVKLALPGRWKTLHFLHITSGAERTKPFRYIIHFADGSRQEFAPENSGSAVPAGWLRETLSGRNLRLVEWTNREREEISGVTAEFQRNLKEIQSVEIECLNPAAPGALLAVTGTPADEP